MHLGKFHFAIVQIDEEISSSGLPALLENVFNSLQQYVASSNDQTSQQFKQHLDALEGALEKAPSNNASPTYRTILEQIGASQNLGRGLSREIRKILDANNVIPARAHSELTALRERFQKFVGLITSVKNAFTELRVEIDQLEPGQCELGIVLPRAAVGETLGNLAIEFKNMEQLFIGISQLVGEGHAGTKVKILSASDWQVFLDQAPATIAATTFAIERIVALYKSMLEIRKLKHELEKYQISEDTIKKIDGEIDLKIHIGVEETVKQLSEQYPNTTGDDGTYNESKICIRIGLYRLAKRINQGATVEATARPPEAPTATKPAENATPQEVAEYDKLNEQYKLTADLFQKINASGLRIADATRGLGHEQPLLINYDADAAEPDPQGKDNELAQPKQ